jgi:hypothetical protein
MWILAASVVSAIMFVRMACKWRQQNEQEIDERAYFAPPPLSRQRFGN